MPEVKRSDVERHNNLIFVAILGALVLSFLDENRIAFVIELACRAVIVVLVVFGLVKWRRAYFAHWTSWLTLVIALLSVLRVVQVFTV